MNTENTDRRQKEAGSYVVVYISAATAGAKQETLYQTLRR